MTRARWHQRHEGARYTLARHWPPRFDLVALSDFPPVKPERLARQVRQDIWREFQRLRGFSPVVVIDVTEIGCRLQAGGRVLGPVPGGAVARLQKVLDDPARRARWIAWARRRVA